MQNWKQIQQKIQPLPDWVTYAEACRKQQETLVFTNGVFDLLHLGHIDYLSRAADLGTRLIIGLNSDDSVRRLNKGPARPIKDQQTRAVILASLFFVDGVVIFGEDTPFSVIQALKPDVLVKGGDYDPEEQDPESKRYIVGSKEVRASGGQVKVIDFVPGHSTTRLEQKIRNT